MHELDHLSYSSISAYLACPRAWKYHYIDKIKMPTSPSLIFGTAFHQTVQTMIAAQRPVDVVPIWNENWSKVQQQEIAWNGELPEQLGNEGLRMLSHPATLDVVNRLKPLIENRQPVIEKRIELRVPDVPVPIIGFVDLITKDGIPHDFKTAARSWTQEQAQSEMQPLFYLAALGQMGYTLNPDLKFRHVVFVKTKTPQCQVFESVFNYSQYFFLIETIQHVWRGIKAEVFPPNPGTWKCSERYCEYWKLCRGKP